MKVRRVNHGFASVALVAVWAAMSVPVAANTAEMGQVQARAAYRLLASGDTEQAVLAYAEVIKNGKLAPEDLTNALLNKALAEQKLARHDDAIGDYTAALSLDVMANDLRATALYNRGLSYHKNKNLGLAIEDYTNALLLNPHMPHAFLGRGQALRDSGQYLFALSDFERALKYGHPEKAKVHFTIATTYEALNRPNDARRQYEAALVIKPDFTSARDRLAKLGTSVLNPLEILKLSDEITAPTAGATTLTTALASSEVTKPQQLKPVEPTPELLAPAPTVAVVAAQKESPISIKKKITDRLPVEVQTAAVPAQSEPISELASPETTGSITAPEETGPETRLSEEERKEFATAPISDDAEAVAERKAVLGPALNPSDWAIQFASATTEAGAWTTWKNLQKKHALLSDLAPIVVRADLGTKGVVYRVRLTGYNDQGRRKSDLPQDEVFWSFVLRQPFKFVSLLTAIEKHTLIRQPQEWVISAGN